MNNIFNILLGILCILVIFQLIYSYLTFSSFSCPDCPECIKEEFKYIPSNLNLTNYLMEKFIDIIDKNLDNIHYISNNFIFSNDFKINFVEDFNSIILKINKIIMDNKLNFIEDQLKYLQFNDENKINFNKKYNINKFPSPLVYFKDPIILFGYLNNNWKIFIDMNKLK